MGTGSPLASTGEGERRKKINVHEKYFTSEN
jgi:hypothetical protein